MTRWIILDSFGTITLRSKEKNKMFKLSTIQIDFREIPFNNTKEGHTVAQWFALLPG